MNLLSKIFSEKIFKRVLPIALFLALCFAIGYGFGQIINESFPEEMGGLALFLRISEALIILFLAVFLHTVLHEVGHMIAALLRGWKFVSFMVFSFLISRKNGKFHVSRFNISGAGGQCIMLPPEKGDTNFGIAFYNAGGLLMNLVIVATSVVGFYLSFGSVAYEISVLLYGLVVTGLFMFFINAIPGLTGDMPNDGSNIIQLHNDSFATEIFLQNMRTVGMMQQGYSLNKIDTYYLSEGHEIDYRKSMHAMAVSYDLSLAIARHDFVKAHALVSKMKLEESKMPNILRNEIALEKIYLQLVSPAEGEDVKSYLTDEIKKYMETQEKFRPSVLRVKFALARLYEFDEKKAEKIFCEFRKVCENYFIPGEAVSERELVDFAKSIPLKTSTNR